MESTIPVELTVDPIVSVIAEDEEERAVLLSQGVGPEPANTC